MFEGDQLAEAIAVPLYYGLVEAITLGIYCTFAWKIGWTKAPSDESFCKILTSSYENDHKGPVIEVEGVEVVLGTYPKEGAPTDLVFEIETASSADSDDMVVGVSYPSPPRKSNSKELDSSIELQRQSPLVNDVKVANSPISTTKSKFESSPLEEKSSELTIPQDNLACSTTVNETIVDIADVNNSVTRKAPTLTRKLSAQINRFTNGDKNGIQNGVYTVSPTEESDSDDLHSVEGQVIAIV